MQFKIHSSQVRSVCMSHNLKFRQVHLDFHTSPCIPGIGEAFDKQKWQRTLKTGHIDSITCFATCHHGMAYYDSSFGNKHPELTFDLLRAQFDACKEININVPIYLTAGVNNWAAYEHPEWREVGYDGRYNGWAQNIIDAGFHMMCFNSPYLDLLVEQIKEVAKLFPNCDGIFTDIISQGQCCCKWCLATMAEHGLDAEKESDRLKMSDIALEKYYSQTTAAAKFLDPDIHPQGSIALGTVIKPLDNSSSYDVDLICLGVASLDSMTQKELKEFVGIEIYAYAEANSMKKEPEEGRRNWKLEYADSAQFHMDILPSLKDGNRQQRKIIGEGYSNYVDVSSKAIAITDTDHYAYNSITFDWPSSNPLGYREWFLQRMKTAHKQLTESMAISLESRAEEIPAYKVKTPLQRAVQILKRHRDIMFAEDSDNKPISIIITTLAAQVYDNETSLLEAMRKIVFGMKRKIEDRGGIKWIQNPVNPLENFADKWQEHPEREEVFYDWLDRVGEDFNVIFTNNDISMIGGLLNESFGAVLVKKIAGNLGKSLAPVQSRNTVLDVAHRKPLQWPFEARYDVSVTAKYSSDGFRYTGFKSGDKLVKNLNLLFTAHTHAPKRRRKFYWQVVNTGTQATNANQLRGDIFIGKIEKGRSKRREETSYAGLHWIECFVVVDGVCVGRSGEFLVVIE